MALMKCPECGKDISTAAPSCPACGWVPPKETSRAALGCAWVVGAVVVFFIIVASIGGGEKRTEQPAPPQRESALTALARATDEARQRAPELCRNLKGKQRKQHAECLMLDCPGATWPLYQSAVVGNVEVGMNLCLVKAVWGDVTDISSTATARGKTWHVSFGERRRVLFDDTDHATYISE